MGRVIPVEIHSSDLDRAERFYTAVFGWTVTRWDGAPINYFKDTEGNIFGALQPVAA